jgi:hypothetical protein
MSANLRTPYLMESAIAIERQLPAHTTIALTYVNSHGVHQFLTNDINAPLPGTYNPQFPGSGSYPLGNANPVFLVESAGLYNQNDLIANVNSKVNASVSLFGSYLYNRAMSNTDYSSPPENTDFNPAISTKGFGVGSFPLIHTASPASMGLRRQTSEIRPHWVARSRQGLAYASVLFLLQILGHHTTSRWDKIFTGQHSSTAVRDSQLMPIDQAWSRPLTVCSIRAPFWARRFCYGIMAAAPQYSC